MADDDSTTTDAGTDSATEPPGDQGKPEVPPEVRRALAKANREAESLRLKLREFEDRDKTELQKLTEAHQSAARDAAEARAEAMRYRVAVAKGVPAELAERLRGQTAEELEADADKLLSLLGSSLANGKPPSFDSGARTTAGQPTDMNALIRRAAGHQ